MKQPSRHQKYILEKIGILCIALLFVVALIWFISSTKNLYRRGELLPHYYGIYANTDHTRPMMDVGMIEPWMTFNYINIVFRLPPSYLQNTLSITDPRYPNIRLDYYSKHHNIDTKTFLQNIQQIITNYTTGK